MRLHNLALVFSATLVAQSTLAAPVSKGVFAGYFTSWSTSAGDAPLAKYDELSFFGAVTTSDGIAFSDGKPDKVFTPALSKAPNAAPLLAIGGWGGSRYYSSLTRTPESRKKFAEKVVQTVKDNGFAGVDIDWTFPNGKPADAMDVSWDKGNTCFEYHADDTANLLEFIKVLRPALEKVLKKKPILTAAFPVNGLSNASNEKLNDARPFVAKGALDYITVMQHDIASNYKKNTGINAPLDDKNAPDEQKMSIASSMKYWLETARVPADKIQLALPTYGKVFKTTLAANKDLPTGSGGSLAYQPKQMPKTSPDSKELGSVQVGKYDKQGEDGCKVWRDFASIVNYPDIVADYAGKDGKSPMNGFKYYWDETTASPFLYNSKTQLFVTYDNPDSIKAKTKWAKSKGLMGIKMYSVQGDTGALIEAARQGWAS